MRRSSVRLLAARAQRRRCDRSARRRSRTRRRVAVSMSRASASRNSARARNSRVRTVAGGMERHSAVSSTVMSSTSRITNTVRNATGSSSIRRSSSAPDLRRAALAVGGDSLVVDPARPSPACPRPPPSTERHDDAVPLLPAQPHQRVVDDDAREPRATAERRRETRRCADRRRDTHPAARLRPRRRLAGSRGRRETAGRCARASAPRTRA